MKMEMKVKAMMVVMALGDDGHKSIRHDREHIH